MSGNEPHGGRTTADAVSNHVVELGFSLKMFEISGITSLV